MVYGIKPFGGEINDDALTWSETMVAALTRWIGEEGCDLRSFG